jgi:hypothetical protein
VLDWHVDEIMAATGSRTLLESFTAMGHPNMQSCHKTTLEFTREANVTLRGDCIAGVRATLAPASFKPETKALLRSHRSFLVEIRAGGLVENIRGKGHPDLALDDEHEMVFRKSQFVSGRTVLVSCDKASADIDARVRQALQQDGIEISVSLYLLD